MDAQQLVERFSPFVKRNYLPLALGFFGLILLVYGLIVLIGSSSNSAKDIVFEGGRESTESAKPAHNEIFVDVEGYVVKPGVYRLGADSRVQEALVAAGGLSGSADRKWVAQNLNLALRLKDGTKVYIPGAGEVVKSSTPLRQGSAGQADTTRIGEINQSSLINVNTASEQELDSLSGIGPVTAQKIIDNRPYNSIDELLTKKVVSKSVFEKIKEKISIY